MLPHASTSRLRRYLVTQLMGSDLNNIIKTQALTDEHVQLLIYQILRGLKVHAWNVCEHHFLPMTYEQLSTG